MAKRCRKERHPFNFLFRPSSKVPLRGGDVETKPENKGKGYFRSIERGTRVSGPGEAKKLMTVVKYSIIEETSKAVSAYANLGRSGKHIVWVTIK